MLKRLAWLLVIALFGAGGAVWWVRAQLVTPYRAFRSAEVFVELPAGARAATIGARLAEAGVVRDAWLFRAAVRLLGADRAIKAGEYRFTDPASPFEVVDRLAKGDVFSRGLTFPEGLTIREMAEIFAKGGVGTSDEFLRAAADGSLVAALDPEADSLEGYLFPDTYAWPRTAGAPAAIHAMVARFEHAFSPELRAAAAAEHLSPRELVTLASIVEKETAAAGERPMVAAVYRNRLKIGMPLQCDPTVVYAMMKAGRWRGNLTRNDLAMDSRYNTYRYPGLPPGPIASPGRASLEAVLHPADVPYLYFVSRNDGTHAFASTLTEHNRNVTTWQVQYFKHPRTH